MKRRQVLVLVPALLLALWLPQRALADSTLGASLGCNDPNGSFVVNTDLTTFNNLASAVQGMALFPAELSCGLSQTSLSLTNNTQFFVVGGGQAGGVCGGKPVNFGISGHLHADASVNGSISFSTPTSNSLDCQGHFKASVTCVQHGPTSNTAVIAGPVAHADGVFAFLQGQSVVVDASDNGHGQNGQPPDSINVFGETAPDCVYNAFQFPLTHGSITVKTGG